jgi:hypothetical protein
VRARLATFPPARGIGQGLAVATEGMRATACNLRTDVLKFARFLRTAKKLARMAESCVSNVLVSA